MWGNDNVRGIALAFFLAVAIKIKSIRTVFCGGKDTEIFGICKKNVSFNGQKVRYYSANNLLVGIDAAKNPIAVTTTAVATTSNHLTSTG